MSGDGVTGPAAPTREEMTRRLDAVFGSLPARTAAGRRAAVAIVIGEEHGRLGFLLTQRTARLKDHAGQYALPGGRLDKGESVRAAALREVREEIGLVLTPGDVIGHLPEYETASGFGISPVVIWASDLGTLDPSPDEVAWVYHIPLSALSGPAVPTLLRAAGSEKPILQLPLGGDRVIHPPTGAILYQFAEAVLMERYVDAQSFAEPVWARR